MATPKDYQFDLPTVGRPEMFNLGDLFFPGIKDSLLLWLMVRQSLTQARGMTRSVGVPMLV